ncbi:MAG: FixH family protein [Gammaproteobacteria bacterium]|nr:FixH family protein [Gammaproteobacteria bacterium]
MENKLNTSSIPPWYKQFWPWFLISLPGSVVIASIITIFIAFNTQDTVVVDNYYKEGLAINRDLSRQQHAEKLDVRATLQLHENKIRLYTKTTNTNADEKLLLRFTHPTLSDRDQQIALSMISSGIYQANILNLSDGIWNVALLSSLSNWEIKTRINYQGNQTTYTIR